MKKLVRDKIPEMIVAKGEKAVFYRAEGAEYRQALWLKLLEECEEFRSADDRQNLTEEAADVLEVITAICCLNGVTMDEVAACAEKTRQQRGGFDEGYILEL